MDLNEMQTPDAAVKNMSFPLACMKFFGKLPNQSTREFADELKALLPEDKVYFTHLFSTVGINIIAS